MAAERKQTFVFHDSSDITYLFRFINYIYYDTFLIIIYVNYLIIVIYNKKRFWDTILCYTIVPWYLIGYCNTIIIGVA